MERVIVSYADGSVNGRAVIRWAAREAALRGLSLRDVHGSPPDVPDTTRLVVAAVPGLDVPAFSAHPLVLVPERCTARRAAHAVPEVVLGLNARRPAPGAVDFAFDAARLRGVRLRVVHAWQFPSRAAEPPFGVPEEDRGAWEDQEVRQLADVLRPWREKYPEVQVLEDVRLFTPAHALVERSTGAGLVVVGRRSESEPGTVARALSRDARCPVAVVPS
ncbi:universal stress protein [Streptomyces sp. NBC_01478]|uniref:universal stress protein n=1 Tax=Streptomyces sp. NBC_01478 TaxID=2903882 RepID=UPI002E36D5C1|nr:universal stress protein [Streptomyces sp. NBC_01478]